MVDENFYLLVVVILLQLMGGVDQVRAWFFPRPSKDTVQTLEDLKEILEILKRTDSDTNRLRIDGLTRREHRALVSVHSNLKKLLVHFDMAPEELT